MKQFLKKCQANLIDARWNIGIADVDEELNIYNIRYVRHGHSFRESWFADPFVIDETDRDYIILAEEMLVNKSRGRIVRLTVNKADMGLSDFEVLLDLDTHLSFPNHIKTKDGIFLYPENGASGELSFYRYGKTLEKCGVILEKAVYDSTICRIGDDYYLLATEFANPNGNVLSVFISDNPLSGYRKIQEISFPDNIARRGGNVFVNKGQFISPAQVCNKYYGEVLSFQTIEIKDGKISLKEFKRIYPEGKMLSPGFHTWNFLPVSPNKVVVDGYRFGSKFFHDMYFKIRGLKEM
ncbi:MAG: hypothetical protein II527_06075 [Bacteroidales bacterium]|nr:hypothetical protein [Bacteroidales bacterium]